MACGPCEAARKRQQQLNNLPKAVPSQRTGNISTTQSPSNDNQTASPKFQSPTVLKPIK